MAKNNKSNNMNTLLEAWNLLGLTRGNTDRNIKRKYQKLALTAHPNKGGSNEAFKRLQRLYNAVKQAHANKRLNAVANAAARRHKKWGFNFEAWQRGRARGPTFVVRHFVVSQHAPARRRHSHKGSYDPWAKVNLSGPWDDNLKPKPAITKKKKNDNVALLVPKKRGYGLPVNMLQEIGVPIRRRGRRGLPYRASSS